MKKSWRPLIFLVLLLVILILYFNGGREFLNFHYIKSHLNDIQHYYDMHPWKTISIFLSSYILITTLSIPGSVILTILAGSIFGVFLGTLQVAFAASIGAVLAFLISRYLLKDFMMKRLHRQSMRINHNVHQDQVVYLLTIRMIPVSPFVVINIVMGLTSVHWWTFFWTTFLGMIPGHIIYVYAGKKLASLDSVSEIMTPSLIVCLCLIGLLPVVVKKMYTSHRRKLTHG